LSGVSGAGKTRLAVEVAWRAADRFEGAARVDLAAISDADDRGHSPMDPVGVKSSTVAGIVRSLRAREVLVVFDNCEHVLEAVAQRIDEVAASTTDCRLPGHQPGAAGVEGEQLY
jgi:predicted ATPase